jgi:hypothetical protein
LVTGRCICPERDRFFDLSMGDVNSTRGSPAVGRRRGFPSCRMRGPSTSLRGNCRSSAQFFAWLFKYSLSLPILAWQPLQRLCASQMKRGQPCAMVLALTARSRAATAIALGVGHVGRSSVRVALWANESLPISPGRPQPCPRQQAAHLIRRPSAAWLGCDMPR